MANSRIYFKSEAGGTTTLSRDTSANSGNLVLPASGNVASVDTAVTDNAIARYDSTTGKLQNSGVIIDDSNRLLVGTPNATAKAVILTSGETVLQAVNSGIAQINIGNNGTSTNYFDADTQIYRSGAGTERVRIDTNGNVGIGVAPSAWSGFKALQQQNTSISSNLNEQYITSNGYYNGSNWIYNSNTGASQYLNNQGIHTWKTAPSGTAGNAITLTNAMTLDASGDLIVGGSNTNKYIIARYDGNNQTYIRAASSSDYSIVYSSAVGGVTKSVIYANGNFGSANQVYSGVSDIKLKENVVDATPKLEKLMQVQVRNFNFIGQEDKQIGVIAQEIEQIFPSLIFETKDTKQVEVTKTREVTDEEGNVTTEEYTETETVETGEVTKNVKYSVIYMMMLKGMQEMRAEYTAEINDLKARIEILEGAK